MVRDAMIGEESTSVGPQEVGLTGEGDREGRVERLMTSDIWLRTVPSVRLLCDRSIVLKLTQKRKSVSKSVSLMEVGLSELWRCRGTLMTSLIGTD